MLSMVESMDAESKSTKKLASESEVENVGKRSRKFFCSFFLFVFRVSYPELVCLGL